MILSQNDSACFLYSLYQVSYYYENVNRITIKSIGLFKVTVDIAQIWHKIRLDTWGLVIFVFPPSLSRCFENFRIE